MPPEQATGAIGASNLNGDGGVRACVCARVGVSVCVRVCGRERACVHVLRACVRECVRDVFAIYDNNISPRLIMIIIKIIIPHFIQIRHTDDFHSTGTRLVTVILCHTRF